MKKQRGFTLLEMLLVCACLLILVAIALPAYLKSQQAAQQSSMAGSMKTLFTSVNLYESMFPLGLSAAQPPVFTGLTLSNLGNGGTPGFCSTNPPPIATPLAACLVGDDLSVGVKGPYTITIVTPFSVDGTVYQFVAKPTNVTSPLRWYGVNATGQIVYSTNQGATWNTL